MLEKRNSFMNQILRVNAMSMLWTRELDIYDSKALMNDA